MRPCHDASTTTASSPASASAAAAPAAAPDACTTTSRSRPSRWEVEAVTVIMCMRLLHFFYLYFACIGRSLLLSPRALIARAAILSVGAT